MSSIREQDPLKQGLKQSFERLKSWEQSIREQDPLKQGLKLNDCPCKVKTSVIREQDPLKQGLKLGIGINIIKLFFRFASKIH